MSLVVTVFPSGHAFACESEESILDAGLRAGVSLDHSCSTGTCGRCKARLIAGQCAPSDPHDYAFTEAQRAAGWLLMCRNRPLSDVLIETQEAGDPGAIPIQEITAKVSKVERLGDDLMLLHVRTPRAAGLQFLAGQWVDLGFPDGPTQRLPIASCPCDSVHLRFHLSYRAQDPFTEFVFNRMRKGQAIQLRGPLGDFVLAQDSEKPLIFVAWELGFAPVQSLIEHAVQIDSEREISLYWLSARSGGHYLANYCRSWADALDYFDYRLIETVPLEQPACASVFAEILRSHRPVQAWDWYLALPRSLQTAFRGMVGDAAPGDRFHFAVPPGNP